MAEPLMNRFASPACIPKNVPRESGGKIFEIMDIQALAVIPPPSPCHIRQRNVKNKPALGPIRLTSKATITNARNGILSWMVESNTVRLYDLRRDTCPAVNNWGSNQPAEWMAGTSPISVAELVIVATNRGRMVPKETKPIAIPNMAPSARFAVKLCFRFCRTSFSRGESMQWILPYGIFHP